jgi:hypothetical protein
MVLEKIDILSRIRNRIRNFLKVGSGSVTLRKVVSGSVTNSFGSTALILKNKFKNVCFYNNGSL